MSNTNTNEIEEDFLEVDQPIPGQNFVCISFISPEKVIKQKEIFFMKKFLHDLLTDEKKKEYLIKMDPQNLTYEKVNDMVEDFKITNEKKVNDEFDEIVDFRTSTRGVKIRGTYDTLKEARVRSKILQRKDDKFNVFVGQVGYWLPWDPNCTDDIDNEYQEKQLNELMKNYKINSEQRDMFYQQEKQEKIDAAIKENAKRKQENIEKGNINPEKIPKDNVAEKIDEFRNILDEKDRKFNEIVQLAGNTTGCGGSEMAAIVGDEKQENTDMFSTSDGHADPWMQRKEGKVDELPEPSDEEVVTHDANDISSSEQNNNLDDVVKNIF